MLHKGKMRAAGLLTALALAGCGPDGDVELLALPPLERPSAEARLGLPEVEGVWTFVGWEILEGDSTSLERTFPSFGQLQFETQRLDSIAGSFVLGGGPVPVVGDVRRDGKVTFVTLSGGNPAAYVAGSYVQDTLWLELTSILPRDEWPQDARAAFVREASPEPPFAWLRGARIQNIPPPQPLDSLAADSTGAAISPVGAGAAGSQDGLVTPQAPPAGPSVGQPPVTRPPATPATPTPAAGPRGQQQPTPPAGQRPPVPAPEDPPAPTQPRPQPQPQQPPAQQPPAQQPPAQQPPAPQPPAQQPRPENPAPTPAPQEPAEALPPLLGEPINFSE